MAVSTGIGGCSYTLGPPSGWSGAIYHSNVSPIHGWGNAHCALLLYFHRSIENNVSSTTERWHRRLMRLQHSLTDPRKKRSWEFKGTLILLYASHKLRSRHQNVIEADLSDDGFLEQTVHFWPSQRRPKTRSITDALIASQSQCCLYYYLLDIGIRTSVIHRSQLHQLYSIRASFRQCASSSSSSSSRPAAPSQEGGSAEEISGQHHTHIQRMLWM